PPPCSTLFPYTTLFRSATRDDLVERAQVRVAVDLEAVHGHPALDPDADRGDLALGTIVGRGQPHAAAPLHPAGGHAQLVAHRDQGLFQPAHEVHHVDRVAQLDDRIPDQLAGAVPGDLAAAVDIHHRGAVRR